MKSQELISIRKKLAVSQMALAKESSVSRFRISLFESGYINELTEDELVAIKNVLKKRQIKK